MSDKPIGAIYSFVYGALFGIVLGVLYGAWQVSMAHTIAGGVVGAIVGGRRGIGRALIASDPDDADWRVSHRPKVHDGCAAAARD